MMVEWQDRVRETPNSSACATVIWCPSTVKRHRQGPRRGSANRALLPLPRPGSVAIRAEELIVDGPTQGAQELHAPIALALVGGRDVELVQQGLLLGLALGHKEALQDSFHKRLGNVPRLEGAECPAGRPTRLIVMVYGDPGAERRLDCEPHEGIKRHDGVRSRRESCMGSIKVKDCVLGMWRELLNQARRRLKVHHKEARALLKRTIFKIMVCHNDAL